MEATVGASRHRPPPLTVAGAAQVGRHAWRTRGILLPVELRHANHTASTNPSIVEPFQTQNPTIRPMASGSQIDPLVERVERLLVRYEELQRTNALLAEQVDLLTQERDSLRSRLSAARARVDALLERLPDLNTPA
jgi:chromosome segregation ATPase